MRKQDTGRLSSSATNIRASNYSVPRCYGPSLSTYRYSASSYTPTVRSSVRDSSDSAYSSASLSRASASSLSSGSSLTRSSSSSYARSPYQSPANTRTGGYTPSTYSYSSSITPSHAPTSTSNQSSSVPPITTRSRSSSAISSYRSINVAHLNAQAKERADREEKDKNYVEWLEREKIREQENPTQPPIMDFRKKLGSTGSAQSSSPGYAQFFRSVSGRTEVAPPPTEPPKYSYYKPTATVQPLEDTGERAAPSVQPGFTGLRNIGNTCFMNATLQMLVNNIELKTYFLQKHYKMDVNVNNPLGFKGRLADAFAEFMRSMWNGQHRAIEPVKIKELVAEKASQFANFAQHDAHEFLSFLLDGLHEDVNRVKAKPLTHTVEGDGRPDIEVASEAWGNHTLRNDSIFVDLYHGQLKSRLQCPNCERVSITFDPFVYLAVPFPKAKKTTTVYFWPQDPQLLPIKVAVQYNPEGVVHELLSSLSDLVRVAPKNLRLVEVFSHRVQKVFTNNDKTSDICSGDVLYAFQVHDPIDCNEPVLELFVIQRQLYLPTLRYACNECGKSDVHLKACEACYNAYYCNKECQLSHWNTGGHRDECRRRSSAEAVGQPFMISLPRSQLTYQHLMRVVEPKCRYSVDIFQMPQHGGYDSEPATRSGSETSVKEENKKSPSPARNGTGSKRQSVLPEPRKKTEHRMFLLRTLKDQTHIIGETIVADKSGEPLNIPSGTYISLNWYNLRYGKPYINADSKRQLEVDEEKSKQLSKADSGSYGGEGNPTLPQMLSMFSETERLKPEESWYCSRCKDHVEATKKLELYRLPPILIVQLKRFVYTATYQTMHRRSKDERRVIYPLEHLDMSPYLADTAPSEQCTDYDLTGVVCHSGSSYFGHYVSMGRLPAFDGSQTEVDWRTFDDSIVSRQSSSAAQSDDAYLLFYKQKGTGTRHIFRKHYSCDPTAVPNIEVNGIKENGN